MTPEELLSKLEAAPAPSRELDGQMWHVLIEVPIVNLTGACVLMPDGRINPGTPPYTSSIDAAVALAEQVFGEKLIARESGFAVNGGPYSARLVVLDSALKCHEITATHSVNEALALCATVLKAYIAQQEDPTGD